MDLPTADELSAELPDDPLRMLPVGEVTAPLIGEADPCACSRSHRPAFGAELPLESAAAERRVDQALDTSGPEPFHILANDREAALQLRASIGNGELETVSPEVGGPG